MQQLHRAAAQRGRLDPLYQDLSEQLTRILQRLYPVWALIGPGLSDPGHIELHSRWIYLDADELLGPRDALLAGDAPAPARAAHVRRRAARDLPRQAHQALDARAHRRSSSRSDDPDERQLGADRRLLEEPRMEAHGCRDFPPDSIRGRFTLRALQAAVADTLLPRFAAELLAPDRWPAGRSRASSPARAAVYLRARTHYGAADPADARAGWSRSGEPCSATTTWPRSTRCSRG